MATSTVPAVVRALHDLLLTADWPLRPPQVTLGPTRDMEREVVMIGATTGDQEWAQIGGRKRDEDYTVELYVLVARPGDTALEAMDRAWELFAVVEDTLRTNYAPAAETGVLWTEVQRPEGQPTVEDEGHGHVVQSAIRVRARI